VQRTRPEITIEVEEVIQAGSHSKRLAEGWRFACGGRGDGYNTGAESDMERMAFQGIRPADISMKLGARICLASPGLNCR